MARHNAYFMSTDAKAQAQLYIDAFGGEIVQQMTYDELPEDAEEGGNAVEIPGMSEAMKDKIMHMEFRAGGATFYISDDFSGSLTHGNAALQSMTFETEEEAHEAFGKLAQGGSITVPLEPAFWGALHGQIVDKFGVLWMITTESPEYG